MINTQAFISALKYVAHAAAIRDIRYYLNGVRFEFTVDKLVLVGCDGSRLASVALPGATGVLGEFIVSNASVKHLLTMFGKDKVGDIAFKHADQKLTLSNSFGISYCPELVDGTYPEWRRVVPAVDRTPSTMPQIDPNLLAEACKAIAPLCLKVKGTPSIVTNAAGEGNAICVRPLQIANHLYSEVLAVIQPTRVITGAHHG